MAKCPKCGEEEVTVYQVIDRTIVLSGDAIISSSNTIAISATRVWCRSCHHEGTGEQAIAAFDVDQLYFDKQKRSI